MSQTASDFAKLVSDDIKNQTSPNQANALREPEQLKDWYDQLTVIRAQIQSQLTSRRAKIIEIRSLKNGPPWQETEAEYLRWRADVLRFNCSLEERLKEAKSLVRAQAEENREIERNRVLETLGMISKQLKHIEDLLLEEEPE